LIKVYLPPPGEQSVIMTVPIAAATITVVALSAVTGGQGNSKEDIPWYLARLTITGPTP